MQTLETLYERLVELEGDVAGIKAEQAADRLVTQHLSTQFMDLANRIDQGHQSLDAHVQEERAHWEAEIRYRAERESAEHRQRRQDLIGFFSAVGSLLIGMIAIAVSLHLGK